MEAIAVEVDPELGTPVQIRQIKIPAPEQRQLPTIQAGFDETNDEQICVQIRRIPSGREGGHRITQTVERRMSFFLDKIPPKI
jgi:hypothetical protein